MSGTDKSASSDNLGCRGVGIRVGPEEGLPRPSSEHELEEGGGLPGGDTRVDSWGSGVLAVLDVTEEVQARGGGDQPRGDRCA